MAEYMMLMKGRSDSEGWDAYIESLIESGLFRGGSALGEGRCVQKGVDDQRCTVTGFMRFEAEGVEQVKALLAGNPAYEAGDEIEVLELV